MTTAETLELELDSETAREIDMAMLTEIDNLLDEPVEYGPGQMVPIRTSKFGHLVLAQEHIKWNQVFH